MKLAVVAANGKSGRLIVKEAVARGLDVTAVVRGENKTEALHTLKKDIMDLTKEDLAGFDVVIDAFGIWDPNKMDQHSATLGHLSDILSGSKTRLLVVGGAGSLYVDKDHKTMISDLPDFSEAYLPTAVGMKNSLNALRKRDDVRWTYVSPAAEFIADGERTGKYILAGEAFTTNEKGESKISYADYTLAMVDEAVSGSHIHQRISVLGK